MSRDDITTMHLVARWEPDAKGRLQRAALELFADGGFESTTVAEIAERAGVTERTFFRHFADKREVLFSGQHELRDAFVGAVERAGPDAAPDELARVALDAAGSWFSSDHRGHARRRQAVIDANPGLYERELLKLARLAEDLAGALRGRGLSATRAHLTAETTIAVFKVAFGHWLVDRDDRSLVAIQRDLLAATPTIAAAEHRVRPIGWVRSPLADIGVAPKQGDEGAPEADLVVAAEFADGLRDLHVGETILVLTWLDRAARDVLVVRPRDDLTRQPRGVFSTRSADRPNPIGVHRVDIVAIDGTTVRVSNLEAVDGTPIIDVKPVLGPVGER